MGKIIGFEDFTLELPVLRNNDQRKDFLREYHNWKIWFEVPETEETYYRINLPDGSIIVICEYKTYVEWKENMQTVIRTTQTPARYMRYPDSYNDLKELLHDGWKVVMCNKIGDDLEYILER